MQIVTVPGVCSRPRPPFRGTVGTAGFRGFPQFDSVAAPTEPLAAACNAKRIAWDANGLSREEEPTPLPADRFSTLNVLT